MNLFIKVFFFVLFYSFSSDSKNIYGQGAVLRILNKITAEKFFYTVPLSQKLDLDNCEIFIYYCNKIEKDGVPDEIALIKHKTKTRNDDRDFLGWIFKSSKYLNMPTNTIYDIKLEECLLQDPLFLKERRY